MRFFHRYSHGRRLWLVVVGSAGAGQCPSPHTPLLPAPAAVAVKDTARWNSEPRGDPGADHAWITPSVAGDFAGGGPPALITGGLQAYPPFERMSRLTLWRREP